MGFHYSRRKYPIIDIDFLLCHKLIVDVLTSSLQTPSIWLSLLTLFLPKLKLYSQNTMILLKLLTLLNPLNTIFNITSQPVVNQSHHTQDACQLNAVKEEFQHISHAHNQVVGRHHYILSQNRRQAISDLVGIIAH